MRASLPDRAPAAHPGLPGFPPPRPAEATAPFRTIFGVRDARRPMLAQPVRKPDMRHAPSLRHAFSLLELTLVIAIIGVLMAVAALSLGGFGERANVRATKMTLNVVKRALEAYKLEEKSFPPTVQLLKATKYLEDKKVLDAWNEELIYIVPSPGTM